MKSYTDVSVDLWRLCPLQNQCQVPYLYTCKCTDIYIYIYVYIYIHWDVFIYTYVYICMFYIYVQNHHQGPCIDNDDVYLYKLQTRVLKIYTVCFHIDQP
jgi:hypothetical protein